MPDITPDAARGFLMEAARYFRNRPTEWGNPYQAGNDGGGDRQYLADLFRAYMARPEQAALREAVRTELRGRDLACWCSLDGPCHADVLLEIANA